MRIKVGQLIEFNHGYNNDIRSTFKVILIKGEEIYVDWDCHWVPILDNDYRKIKIIEKWN